MAKQFDWSGLLQFAPSVLGAGAAYYGAGPMREEAERLRKERERLLAQEAPGLTPIEQEQLAAARSGAATSRVPGYAQEAEGIAQQQADVLAAGKRGSQTSSNLLNLLSKLNVQGQAARRNLAMRGAQTQQQAQSELGSLAMSADARRVQREQLRERQLAAMDAAARQYRAQAGMAPLQGAISMMPATGYDFDKLFKERTAASGTENIPSKELNFGENLEYQSQYNPPPPAEDNVPRNSPFLPPSTKTGLEREPSMMAAPQYGKTTREFLIENPLLNTTMRPGQRAANLPPVSLKRTPSMLAVPQEEDEYMVRPEFLNPLLNTTVRRTYRPSRMPNTLQSISQYGPSKYSFE